MFELKKENIKFGKLWGDENSIFFLPNGIYEVNANQVNKVKSNKCFFIDEKCSTIMLGANRKLNCCGDILITLKEMGYDISKKENLKKLKDDKDKIVEKYNDLKKNDPGLFELNQLEIDDIKNQYEAELEEAKVKQSDLKQKQQNETTATASNASSGTQIKWGRVFFVFIIFCGTCGYLIDQNSSSYNSSKSSSSKSRSGAQCDWCNDYFSGRGYFCAFGSCQKAKTGQGWYCSMRCARQSQ